VESARYEMDSEFVGDGTMAKRPTPIIRDFDGLLRSGVELLERNRFEQARAVLTQAVELQPNSALAQLALGIALGRLLQIPEALAALERAVQLDATGFYPRFRLGELYMRIGVPSRAREELQHALDLSTNAEQRKLVRELLAVDGKREKSRVWRPDFSRFRKGRGLR
jgi:tetratricopeptide (TPR) repeat protein